MSTAAPPAAAATSGALLLCGTVHWDGAGRKGIPLPKGKSIEDVEFPAPSRIGAADFVSASKAFTHCTAVHAVVIDDEGNAYTFGRNQSGQLGDGTTVSRTEPFKVSIKGENKFVSAAVGRNHTILVSESGRIYASGENKQMQLGTKTNGDQKTFVLAVNIKGEHFVSAACGADYSVAVTDQGVVYSWGSPQYGQLGDGSEHNFISGTNRMVFDPQMPKIVGGQLQGKKIVAVSCGTNHTVALDDTGSVYSWGAGGYGRLGLGITPPKDMLVPTEVNGFKDRNNSVKSIACGPTCCMVIDSRNALHLWGKWRNSGDGGQGTPWMYPKHYQGLSGWGVREISAGFVTLFALADKSCTSWGQSASHGELGHGKDKPRSATNAAIVEPMEGVHVIKAACGLGFTLLIADRNSPKFDSIGVIGDIVSEAPAGAKTMGQGRGKAAATSAGKGDDQAGDAVDADTAPPAAKRGKKAAKADAGEVNDDDTAADTGKAAAAKGKRKTSAASTKSAAKPAAKRGRKAAK